ncbi:MAG: ABC transporter substrate-binding protein [Gudongella sp.]|jgi:iron complex transport system substrate-binding protein|nr:ABC transporter substrate-binding protein [Gudongella sp.]
MKNKKLLLILMGLLLMVSAFTGCTAPKEEPTSPPETTGTSIVITDMMGREINLDEPASRIVALTPADCEILFAIGSGDALVGRGEYCDYPLEVLEVTSVQSGMNTNLEQIIDLKPQVLIMGTMDQTEEQVNALEAAGIKVVVSDAHDIEGVYTSISMIGKLMGKDSEADLLVNSMKSTFAEVSRNPEDANEKTIYFEVSPLEYGLWTAGKGTFMNEIAEMLGLVNCFEDIDGWGEISEEQVLERNPDYIVSIAMYFGDGPTPLEEIKGRTGWENVKAVKGNSMLNLQNDELSRPGPRLAEGALLLSEFIDN